MKRLIVSVLMSAATMFAQNADSPSPSGTASQPSAATSAQQPADPGAQKARTLIDNMIKALGGDAYLSYQTMEQEGRTYSFYHGQPNSAGTLFWRFWRFPDKDRIELTKERDVIYLHVGDKGYEITFKGTALEEAEVTEDFIRRRAHSLEIVLRQWLKDPQTIVLYVGNGLANQQLAEQVSIVNAQNDEVVISIDPRTYLPIQRSFTFRDKDKLKTEDIEIYANYRPIQGIMTAMSTSRTRNGDMVNQRFFTTVRYNTPIPDEQFTAKVTYDPKNYQKKK